MSRFCLPPFSMELRPSTYPWVVVGACVLCSILSAPGQSFAVALYIEPIGESIGASRVLVTTVYAWATITAAATLPFVGRLADRWTSRRYLAIILGLVAVAFFALAAAWSIATLAVAFFGLRLLCQGAIGIGTLTSVVRWFRAYRGRALALVAAGYAVGEFAMPGLIAELQAAFGWRGSLIALGLGYLLVCVPLIAWLVREPEGASEIGSRHAMRDGADQGYTLSAATRTRQFWILAASTAVIPMILTGLLLHQPALFRSVGWSADAVPAALRAYAVTSLTATYLVGWLLERVPTRFGIVASMLALAAALAVPAYASMVSTAVPLYGAILGIAAGASSATNGLIWPDYFGVTSLGSIKGVVSAARNGATAAGAMLVAVLAERSGNYALPLLVCIGIALLTAVIAAVALPPVRSARGAASS